MVRRVLWWLIKWGFVAIVIVIGAVMLFPKPTISWALKTALEQTDIQPASFKVTQATLSKILIEDIRLGPDQEFKAEALQIEFTLEDVWRGQIDGLTLTGSQLTGRLVTEDTGRLPDRVSFGVLDPYLSLPSGSSGGSASLGIPLKVEQGHFSLLSGDRSIIEADIDANIAADGSADVALNALQPAQEAGAVDPLQASARVKTSPSGVEEIALDANVRSFELLDWAVEDLVLKADYAAASQDGPGRAELSARKLQLSRAWLDAYQPFFTPFSEILNTASQNPESGIELFRDVSLDAQLALGRDGRSVDGEFLRRLCA